MTESKTNRQNNLLEDPVAPTLKNMTIPMIYGMILLMTFNLVDTFFVGLLGTQPLAAISFTFPITFTVISLTIGLGIGTSAVIAKALGKGDKESAKNLATSSLFLAAIIVGILAVVGYYFIDETFLLLGASEVLLPLIHQYMDIWFLGCICLIGPMIGNAVLRASGDTKTPSLIMGSAGLINAILDPIFYAFDELGLVRISFNTHEQNQQSRNAIMRLGARFEGISYKNKLLADGSYRNTAKFSIIDQQWPTIKSQLEGKL